MADPWMQASLAVAKGMAEGRQSGIEAGIAQLKARAAQEDEETARLQREEIRLRTEQRRAAYGEESANRLLRMETEYTGLLVEGEENRTALQAHQYFRTLKPEVQAKINAERYREILGLNDIERKREETAYYTARVAKTRAETADIMLMADANLDARLKETRKQELANQVEEAINPSKIALEIATNNAGLAEQEIKGLIAAALARDVKKRFDAFELDPDSDPPLQEARAYALDHVLGIVAQTERYLNSVDNLMEQAGITELGRRSGATATEARVLKAGYNGPLDLWADLTPDRQPMGSSLDTGGPGYSLYHAWGALEGALGAAQMYEKMAPEFGAMHGMAKTVALENYLSQLVIPFGASSRASARDGNHITIHKPWAASLGLIGEDVGSLTDVSSGKTTPLTGAQLGTLIRVPLSEFLTALDVKATSNLNAEAQEGDVARAMLQQAGGAPNVLVLDILDRLYKDIEPFTSPAALRPHRFALQAAKAALAAQRADIPTAELPPPDVAATLSPFAVELHKAINMPEHLATNESTAILAGIHNDTQESIYRLKGLETTSDRMNKLGARYGEQLSIRGQPAMTLWDTLPDGTERYETVDGDFIDYTPETLEAMKAIPGEMRVIRGPHLAAAQHFEAERRLYEAERELDPEAQRETRPTQVGDPAFRARANATFNREFEEAKVYLLQTITKTIAGRTMGRSPDEIEAAVLQEIMDNTTPMDRYYLAASQNEDRARQLRSHVVDGTSLPDWAELLGHGTMPSLIRQGLQANAIFRHVRPITEALYAEDQWLFRAHAGIYTGPEIEGGETLSMEPPTSYSPLSIFTHRSTELVGEGIDEGVTTGNEAKVRGSYGGKEAIERGTMQSAQEQGLVVDIPEQSTVAAALNNPGLLQYNDMLRVRAQATEGERGLAQFPTPELGFEGLFEHTMTNTLRAGQTLDTFLTNYAKNLPSGAEPATSYEPSAAPDMWAEEVMSELALEYGGYGPSTRLVDVDTTALARILAKIISGSSIDLREGS